MATCATDLSAAVSAVAAPCAAVSGYSFLEIAQPPTAREIVRICSSPQCSKAIAAIRQAVPTECKITTQTKTIELYSDILNPITAVCSKGSIAATYSPRPSASNTTETDDGPSTSCGKALADVVVDTAQCTADSGYSLAVISELPTADQIREICASSSCATSIAAIKKAVPSECATGGANGTAFQLYKQVLAPIDASCAKTSNSSQPEETTKQPETVASPQNATATNVPAPTPTSSGKAIRAPRLALINAVAIALVVSLAGLSS